LVFDGIELQGASTNNTVSGNLITANLGHGIDTFGNTIGGNTITGNTISNNGVGVATNTGEEGSGLRVFGATNTTTISNNVLTGNNGSGVLLLGTANRVTISQNAMSGNTRLGIDLLTTGETNLGSTAPGTPFWNGNTGATPNVTPNDNGEAATGGNGLLNFPVITSSTLVGTNLVVTGYARPGSLIELFLATPLTTDPTNTNKGFGQGSAYLGSFTEGTAGTDTNNGTGSYGVGGATVNGLNQGTDNTNLFTFTIPLTGNFAGIAAGSVLTSTATLGNSTSEFSGNVAVNTGPVPNTLTNVSIPNTNGATVLNPNLSGTANGTLSTGTANSIAYYTVTSLPASGTLTYNGTVLTTGNIATTQIANPGLLTYTPVAGFMGGSVSFTYTATDANGVTSATNNNGGTVTNGPATYTIPVAVPSISGYVYEDANYGGGAGRSRATLGAAAVGRAGARVELYDNTGTFVTSAITDINGQYTLPVLASTTYTVRVVDNTVISARTGATFTGTAATGYTSNQLAVQTYNGTTDRVGGEAPTKADAPAGTTGTTLASLNTGTTIAQSQFGLTTGTTLTTTGPDFGFNFDVVTNTNDAGQGSLRQFITNANALGDENLLAQSGSNSVNTLPAGKETSIFMIPSGNAVAGLRAGLISGLTGGVAVIAPATALPIISGPNTYIDGSTQTFNVGNTNNVTLGVGGTVGTAATALSQVNGPEVQLVGSTTTVINTGLNVATTGAGTNLIGLAVYGFGNNAGGGDNDGTANIISAADNFSLSRSVVGTSATSFTTPNVPNLSTNVRITAGSNVAITNNLVGFSALSGIRMGLDIGTGVTVTNNEIRSSSQSANGVGYDGLQIRGSRVTASGNLFVNNAAQGVDAFNSAGSNLITGNTITNNGIGFATNAPLETAGIRLTGTGNTISLNIISNNYGAGVQVTSNAASVISQNAVFGNGTILSGNGTVATGQIGIDLLRDTDNGNLGTGPFVTINDNGDTDGGANGLLNFPVITTSTIQNGNLLVRGFATAGARIEFFVAAPDASGFGEGQTYFAMRTEGLTADDLDNTAGPYSGLINGRNQGAETNQNRFSFSIPLSSLTAAQQAALTASGAQLTSTATLLMAVNGNVGTSEFSGNSPINTPPVPRDVANVTVPNNSGPVVLNPNLTATANGSANGVTNTIASYTVSPASIGTLFFNGTAVTAATVVPAANLNQLTYQPVAGSTTTATFTYTATDANGIVSTTHFNEAGTTITDGPATYRIPVGATADVATTVNGPKELNAGQPSGTYLATFTNNGINVAEGVTQKVTLPAGATLTSAQLTVIQNAYPGTTYSTATRELYFTGATTTLASGATNSFRFAFTAPTTTGTLTGVNTLNSNVTTTSNEVGITANNQATLNLNVNPVADVATTVTGNGPINAGAQGRFTVEFRNLSATGPQTANGVVAMVQLPAGLGIVDVTGGSYNNSTGLVTYAGIMSLNSGQLVSSIITYTQPTAAAVTATASISTTSNEAGQTANNSAAATNNTRAVYDVTTAISGPATVTAGNQVVYNVSTINNGATSAAPNVTQTVTLPAGATNIFVTDGATVSGTTVTFPAISSLAAGQTVNNTVSFTAPGANYAVGASVASAPADANTANNTASVNTAVTAPPVPAANANTFVTVTTPATSATAGTAVTFTVTQGNAGKDAATGVVTRVAIPTGLPISGANAVRIGGNAPTSIAGTVATYAGGATYDSSTGIVTFPTITSQSAGAANNTYTITLVTPASGVVTATANVTATTPDSEAANSVATTQVTVNSAATDVATTLSGPTSAMPGERLTYTVTTTNNGPAPAGNVVQTVTVPAGLAISGVNALTIGGNAPTSVNGGVAAYAGGATYNSNTGVVTFPAIASQAGGSSVTNVIAYNAPANNNTSLANTAAVTTSTAETGVANNRAIVSTTLMTSSDVQVALTGPATIVAGNPLTYAVTTTNNGVSVAGSVATTVQLPTGLAGVVVRNAAGVVLTNSTTSGYNSADGIVRFPAVTNQSAGSDASTSGTITFNAPAGTNLLVPTATATVTGTTDQVAGNNSASLATTVQPATTAQNDLSTIITSSVPTQTAGQPVTFTVTTSNATTSTGAATGVVQTVQLPAGLTSNGGTVTVSGTGVYDNATGLVTFPAVSLPNTGAARTATNTIIISQAPGTDPLVAIASVRGNESDPNVADNTTAPLSVPITPNVDVATSVTGPATITPGSTVSYSVVTRNNSPSPATNVSQTLTLPAGVTSYSLNGGAPITVAAGATITIPVPSTINPGTANTVTNTISFTAPAMSFALTSNVTATGDAGTMGNNVSTQNTATTRNSAPVAANTMNTLQTPEGNTAGPLLLSALSATDADGNTDIRTYTINSIPLPSQGVLRLGTIALGAGDPIALADIAKLTFDPVTGYVGNASFTFSATDAAGAVSAPATFLIAVAQDINSVYTNEPTKGIATNNGYQNGDAISNAFDVNGGRYNMAAAITDSGVRSAALASGSNALPAGVTLNSTTGAITVSDRLLLRSGSYTVTITTVDVNGGTNTQNVTFTIGERPLPVELKEFAVRAVKVNALLDWSTASEKNSDRFEIERSLNGTTFEKIGTVRGQGTTQTTTTYAFTDAGIGAKVQGVVYYRLRQVDTDGTVSYSPVRTVRFEAQAAVTAKLSVFPNPATSSDRVVTLDLTTLPKGTYQASLLDATGRLIRTYSVEGGVNKEVDVQTLPTGTYIVVVRGNGLNLSQRLIKE
ncbi:right-handed parallel beta-helix repeat-containing protein, partial [Hymenobacter sp.]|uniref:right-handed parallel beta-helix repeat-containing protein n=1 Tax=Hymenobacter sp. TaxID=1898978 RepID=UPI002ED94362